MAHDPGEVLTGLAALTHMGLASSTDHVGAFTVQLLRVGYMLSELAADLVEDLPEDAYPGEDNAAVVLEMLVGTIRTALDDANRRDVECATDLIATAADRVLEHLRLALELSRRMHGENRASRSYG